MRSIAPIATRSYFPINNNCLLPFLCLFLPFLVSLEMRLFPSIFVPLPFLYGEYVVRFVPSGWCFLPCDHRLDFAERKGSIRQQRRRIGYIFLNENCVGHDLGTVDSFVVSL